MSHAEERSWDCSIGPGEAGAREGFLCWQREEQKPRFERGFLSKRHIEKNRTVYMSIDRESKDRRRQNVCMRTAAAMPF